MIIRAFAAARSIDAKYVPQVAPAYQAKRTSGGIHLPLIAQRMPGQTGAIGLGDFHDVTYNVLIQIGNTQLPVVLDTGSSDLWVLSTSCQGACSKGNVPLYPSATFNYANIDVTLSYGDSTTGTHAAGPIGSDVVSLAGLAGEGQYFAAINNTNTAVVETGSSGIFGLGFPVNSLLWNEMDISQTQSTLIKVRDIPGNPEANYRFSNRRNNWVMRWFRRNQLSVSSAFETLTTSPKRRQIANSEALLSSFATIGPFIPRLVARGELAAPLFSVTLQRDSIEVGGNQGMLYIGELPPTGGIKPPSDVPDENYPIAWEIPVDDVYFDGVKLPRSQLSASNISLSALIDTGNSLIRGPPDIVAYIHAALGGSRFACSTPRTLAFQIGGMLFPVDPRDLIRQADSGDVEACSANLAATDVPTGDGTGYLYSWNLGSPFLKGVLTAFYYGSLSRPSQDPPRIGFLSTVPPNAGQLLSDDVQLAKAEHLNLPDIEEPSPASLPPLYATGIGGVPLASPIPAENDNTSVIKNGASTSVSVNPRVLWTVSIGVVALTLWKTVG
ncbi:aspartic peptidase domain-containing protein [Scleroderma citrinum]